MEDGELEEDLQLVEEELLQAVEEVAADAVEEVVDVEEDKKDC